MCKIQSCLHLQNERTTFKRNEYLPTLLCPFLTESENLFVVEYRAYSVTSGLYSIIKGEIMRVYLY